MTESIRDSALILDSTREVLAELEHSRRWRVRLGRRAGSHRQWFGPAKPRRLEWGRSGRMEGGPKCRTHGGFRARCVGSQQREIARICGRLSTIPQRTDEHSTNQEKENAAVSTQKRGLAALPQPGDELAGFRIILELGRGAFRTRLSRRGNQSGPAAGGRQGFAARWRRTADSRPAPACPYRAGTLGLRRPGERLARPVHALFRGCRPRSSALRAGGGLVPTQHNGGSLVEALDQVSRKLPDCSTGAQTHRPRPYRPVQPSQTGAGGFPAGGFDRKPCPAIDADVPLSLAAVPAGRIKTAIHQATGAILLPTARSRRASSCAGPAPSRPRSGSWRSLPRASSTPTPADCSTAT